MSHIFAFNRMTDPDEQRSFLRKVADLPRGPLRVTEERQREAADLLLREAREVAAKFGRQEPSLDDHRRAMANYPAWARVWAGDVVDDDRSAEVT